MKDGAPVTVDVIAFVVPLRLVQVKSLTVIAPVTPRVDDRDRQDAVDVEFIPAHTPSRLNPSVSDAAISGVVVSAAAFPSM